MKDKPSDAEIFALLDREVSGIESLINVMRPCAKRIELERQAEVIRAAAERIRACWCHGSLPPTEMGSTPIVHGDDR